ncbi:MAG: fumarylacetoacetate hydrolase family protein [Gammaproteobacteria bacterium]|nr:fumarylacetoacetate hydrolase family protein [Gammaproteobacteria bacterium]MBT4493510.1 fumarylacetoacetate hydrolase family protein [Gammaproteobacteria bacterium]MBT7369534.1 fumarylacetoacetate hydrolase family protein [Gammaproteobacteria bacterium]
MPLVFDPPAIPTLPVEGSADRFPVGEIFCVGRNYADHAIEMGGDPSREPPFFFIKSSFSILSDGEEMRFPDFSNDVHHEVEMVVALGLGGSHVPVEEAMSLVFGYGVGVDMTRRDRQAEAKQKSRPWEAGKTFVHAAPCSAIAPIEETGIVDSAEIDLMINGQIRQTGNINQMIWKVPEIISRLSELFLLRPGDLIFTGTPAGVGPIARGDSLEVSITGLPRLAFKVSSS